MKLDDGVDTEDSFAVATSSAAMPKLENPEDVCHYIQKTRETFPNFFEHATICNFAEETSFEYSSDSYVVLNDILYGFDSPLKAVENCFKVLRVAHARYPFE
ncbi:hypothetical protein Anas_07839 [Armadillidium nasatum]|uniref:Uncharacterized protein n=1 Tax=Armadillidium nasatum TaxID=96803 RepID=A0A5N5SRD0_9CRUS|nr:hypothetical protein Anas_07839 [Armadillidium nasatum]